MRAMLPVHAALSVALLAMPGAARVAAQSAASPPPAQPDSLVERGQAVVAGKAIPYVIRRLPVSSFPDLPQAVAQALTERGCTIPQTYQARRPENVVHGSFARAGSADWAVLCAAKGSVSLLVFFAAVGTTPLQPQVLKTAIETTRLQAHDASGVLGFDWGIDAATPGQVHDAQSGLDPRPVAPDHDALADSVINSWTIYRLYRNNAWAVLEMPH